MDYIGTALCIYRHNLGQEAFILLRWSGRALRKVSYETPRSWPHLKLLDRAPGRSEQLQSRNLCIRWSGFRHGGILFSVNPSMEVSTKPGQVQTNTLNKRTWSDLADITGDSHGLRISQPHLRYSP